MEKTAAQEAYRSFVEKKAAPADARIINVLRDYYLKNLQSLLRRAPQSRWETLGRELSQQTRARFPKAVSRAEKELPLEKYLDFWV